MATQGKGLMAPKTGIVQKRYGTIEGRATAILAVGRVLATDDEKEVASRVGSTAEGSLVGFIPWRGELAGVLKKRTIAGTFVKGDKKVRTEIEGALIKIAWQRTRGLRREPFKSWKGRFADFPEGVQVQKGDMEVLGEDLAAALDLSESSVEEEVGDPDASGEELPHKVSASVVARGRSGSPGAADAPSTKSTPWTPRKTGLTAAEQAGIFIGTPDGGGDGTRRRLSMKSPRRSPSRAALPKISLGVPKPKSMGAKAAEELRVAAQEAVAREEALRLEAEKAVEELKLRRLREEARVRLGEEEAEMARARNEEAAEEAIRDREARELEEAAAQAVQRDEEQGASEPRAREEEVARAGGTQSPFAEKESEVESEARALFRAHEEAMAKAGSTGGDPLRTWQGKDWIAYWARAAKRLKEEEAESAGAPGVAPGLGSVQVGGGVGSGTPRSAANPLMSTPGSPECCKCKMPEVLMPLTRCSKCSHWTCEECAEDEGKHCTCCKGQDDGAGEDLEELPLKVQCSGCRRVLPLPELSECPECQKSFCGECLCGCLTCETETAKCRSCCLRFAKTQEAKKQAELRRQAEEQRRMAERHREAEEREAVQELMELVAAKKAAHAEYEEEERRHRAQREMLAEERVEMRLWEREREKEAAREAAAASSLFGFSSGDEMSRIAAAESAHERRLAAEQRKKHDAEMAELRRSMMDQMRDFNETLKAMQASSSGLEAQLKAEKARADAMVHRVEVEAEAKLEAVKREFAEKERMTAFRLKEEKKLEAAEKKKGREVHFDTGSSAGLFDSVGRGDKGIGLSAKETIVGFAGRPPKGIKEHKGAEETDPLRSWRSPASAGAEEVRRGTGLAGPSPADVEDDEESGEEGSEESEGESPDKDPLSRMANVFEKILDKSKRKGGGDEDDLLHYGGGDDDEVKFQGARGLVAFERCIARWKRSPASSLREVDEMAKAMLGIRKGAPYRLGDVITRLPFDSFNTKKRVFSVLCEIGEALLQGQKDLAAGLVAQAMRWLSLSLVMNDEETSWKLMFLIDPLPLVCVAKPQRPDLQRCGLQDTSQITALCGLIKDEEALGLRVKGAGGGGGGWSKKPKKKKKKKKIK